MDVINLTFEDLNAILKWYNLAFGTKRNTSNFEEMPDQNTLIKIRALLLTKEEQEGRDKKFRDKFGKFF